MHSEKKDFSRSKVYTWTSEPARLNSSFPRIAGRSLPSAPASRPVSQDTMRKWERAARDQTYMCNQAAAFSRCLTKVQENMSSQLKVIQGITAKGKSSPKLTKLLMSWIFWSPSTGLSLRLWLAPCKTYQMVCL